MPDSKPGVKTTEFWMSFLTSIMGPVLAILVASGKINPEINPDQFTADFVPALNAIIEQVTIIGGLFSGMFAANTYAKQRTTLKSGPTKT